MDCDPRITSDGSGYGGEHGWGCNFSFGYGYDIIDEDTETEKCCVQALQFLIAKADAEICDLEDELAILQCQLKWDESDEQEDSYEVCCAAFKRKIGSLISSIQSSSDGNLLSRHDVDKMFEIQRPAERIYDIINALISRKFSVLDEQVLSNVVDLLAYVGSPGTDMDLVQHTTSFESSVEFEEPTTDIGRQLLHAISEESSSDAARYALKDSKEGRDLCKPDIEVMGTVQVDADRCKSEQRSGLIIVNPVMSPIHVQASDEGNSTSAQGEECLAGAKIDESGITSLSAQSEECFATCTNFEDDYVMNVHQVSIGSLPYIQDHDTEDLVEDHTTEAENQSQILLNTHITYNRRKSGSNSIIKGQKVQRIQSNLSGVEPCTPSLTVKPLEKTGKRKFTTKAKRFGQLGINSSNAGGTSPSKESNWQRKLRIGEGITHANTSGILGVKRRQIQVGSRKRSNIQSLEVKISKTTGEAFGAKSLSGWQMLLKSPDLGEVEDSIVASDSTEGNGIVLTGDPINDLENLRLKLEEDPGFLNKLKVSELKAIMKQYKIRGSYKLKKEKIVEALIKQLCL